MNTVHQAGLQPSGNCLDLVGSARHRDDTLHLAQLVGGDAEDAIVERGADRTPRASKNRSAMSQTACPFCSALRACFETECPSLSTSFDVSDPSPTNTVLRESSSVSAAFT